MKLIECKLLCWDDPKNEDLGIEDEGKWVSFVFDAYKICGFYRCNQDVTDPDYFNTRIYLSEGSFTINMTYDEIFLILDNLK